MKIKHFLMPLTAITIVCLPSISLNSCNKTSDETTDEYDNYIFNRTFSILGTSTSGGSTSLCWGTCWILSDATPTNTNDYIYNIVTNWHVMKGIEDVHAEGINNKVWFGCNTKSSGLSIYNFSDYIEFNSFAKYDDSNFTFDDKTTITTSEYNSEGYLVTKTGKKGCDIHVAKADFSSFATSSSSSASIAKTKLNALNKITASGRKITELADTTSDSMHFENKHLYTAGYPVKNTYYATWEKHDLFAENISLTYNAGTQSTSTGNATHWCDEYNNPLTDCTPQYVSSTNVGTSWMVAGASGSMLIGNFGTTANPTFKVCGIYWGGLGNSYSFYPYFSIFNSNWKNYLSQWVE